MSNEPKYLRQGTNIGSVMTMSVDEVQEPELKEKMNTSGMDSMNSQINSQSKD